MLGRIGGRVLLRGFEAATAARLRIQRRAFALSKEQVQEEARRRAGLTYFGADDFEEGLETFLRACEREARLTALGRYVVHEECVRILSNRLRLTDLWVRRPDLLAVPVERPVFILGPPRTGSTFLHGLLSGAPGLRAPLLWEMLHPTATLNHAALPPAAASAGRWLRAVNPQLAGIHELRMDAPEECTFLLQHSFQSFVLGTVLSVPSYVTWLIRKDLSPAYHLHRRLLQTLGAGRDDDTWLLKSPAHLYSLRALLDVYPDARFVYLHRPMGDVLASFCSVRRSVLGMTSRTVDPREIGMYSLVALRAAAAASLDGRAVIHPDRVIDVRFEDIMASPLEVAERVWVFLGIDGGRAVRSAAALVERRPPRRGQHRYRLEDFDLQPQAVKRHFAEYSEWSQRVAPAVR